MSRSKYWIARCYFWAGMSERKMRQLIREAYGRDVRTRIVRVEGKTVGFDVYSRIVKDRTPARA